MLASVLNSFAVLNYDLLSMFVDYGRRLLDYDMTGPYAFYRDTLKVLAQGRPAGERYLLKCPEHLWFIDALLVVFPDARIVWTHRDPVACVAVLLAYLAGTAHALRPDRPVAPGCAHPGSVPHRRAAGGRRVRHRAAKISSSTWTSRTWCAIPQRWCGQVKEWAELPHDKAGEARVRLPLHGARRQEGRAQVQRRGVRLDGRAIHKQADYIERFRHPAQAHRVANTRMHIQWRTPFEHWAHCGMPVTCGACCTGHSVRLIGEEPERIAMLAHQLGIADPVRPGPRGTVPALVDHRCPSWMQTSAVASMPRFPPTRSRPCVGSTHCAASSPSRGSGAVDPGCGSNWMVWKQGPSRAADHLLPAPARRHSAQEAQVEDALVGLLRPPTDDDATALARVVGAMGGQSPSPAFLDGFARRCAERLAAMSLPRLLAWHAPTLQPWLDPVVDQQAREPARPDLSAEQAFVLELARRLVYLRRLGTAGA